MNVTIVIPCFNESDNVDTLADELGPVIESLQRECSVELVFVDDGSSDGTGDLLERRFATVPETRVVRHDRNRGLGAALRTGFKHATGDIVVATDSDNTYSYSLIIPLLDLLKPGVDIVTASCYHPSGHVENVPGYRIFFSRIASLMYRVLLDWHIHTYTCMFRAYRRRVLETVTFLDDGFLSVTELLANALLMGYAVKEMPCTLRVRRYGTSKAKLARTIRSHLIFQWRLLRTKSRLFLPSPSR